MNQQIPTPIPQMASSSCILSTLNIMILGLLLLLLLQPATSSDYTTLAFKGCANQNFQDPTGSSSTLKTLFASLLAQSSTKSFYSTTTSGDSQSAISGLFQCRGDLTNDQCSTCVSKAQSLASKLCGSAVAARVQLAGCYVRYQAASGFADETGTQLLYRTCGSKKASSSDFDASRDTALGMVVSGVAKNGSFFYTGSYQSVYVLGQCEEDLSEGDCGGCVKSAVATAKSECGEAVSGQVYLNRCYVSYSYYANGVPSISSASSGTKEHTQRTVAIAVGGVAAFGFLVALLMCFKSSLKKRRAKHGDW